MNCKIDNGLCLTHGFSVSDNVPCPGRPWPSNLAETKEQIEQERFSGWLKWLTEERYKNIEKHFLEEAELQKIYDIWELDWKLIVLSSIGN